MLLVSDTQHDETLFREALSRSGLRLNLVVVHSIQEAVGLLKNPPASPESLPPDFITVDLNSPYSDPSELLLWIQNNRTFRVVPVVILTTANSYEEATRAYSLGANAVVAKPHGRDELFTLYESLCYFWSLCQVSPTSRAA